MDDCQWAEGFGAPGLDGQVYALAEYDDGSGPALYAGGWFDVAGGVAAYSIAKWDGDAWSPLGIGVDGHVHALAVYDDGTGAALYVGGDFVDAGGVTVQNIAKWDGAAWSAVRGGLDDEVLALTVHDDGGGAALFAGGWFNIEGGMPLTPLLGIAKWDGEDWLPVGGGMDFVVLALTVHDDGGGPALYAGGGFETAFGVNGAPDEDVWYIAKWRGNAWSAVGDGMDDWVESLAVYDDGTGDALYVGGFFTVAFDAPAGPPVAVSRIAQWKDNAWSALAAGVDEEVMAMTVFDDGGGSALYVGGVFHNADGAPAAHIARWSAAGWAPLGDGANHRVLALASYNPGGGERLFAGGNFYLAGEDPATGIAQWDGAAWSEVHTPGQAGFNDPVLALVEYDDGNGSALYAGGEFTVAGGLPIEGVAKWNGSAWTLLGAGLDCSGAFPHTNPAVGAMAVYDDGSGPALFVGGAFDLADGQPVSGIAKWDGAAWSSPGVGLGASGGLGIPDPIVEALTVFDDGGGKALFVGGQFDLAGGGAANYVAKWDGAAWTALGPGVDDDVETLAVFDDGGGPALYAGGEFHNAGGAGANHVAKWDGAAWTTLGAGVDDEVEVLEALDIGGGTALFAGGDFHNAGGVVVNHIAMWDGAVWSALGAGTNDEVEALAVYDDGGGPVLYAAGDFEEAGGVDVWYVARWDGAAWTPMEEGLYYDADALAVFDDGGGRALYVGGYFDMVGTAPTASAFIAKWHCPTLDYGDALGAGYPTLLADDGARHTVSSGIFLGASADAELDGQPNTAAAGDNDANTDDEEGVAFTSRLAPGAEASIEVTASAAGKLDAWIDLNRDGDWEDSSEKIFDDLDLTSGANPLTFSIPADADPGATYARFRFSTAGAALPTGRAEDGEVEDYALDMDTPASFSIDDVDLDEGDAGQTVFSFTVTRDHNLHAATVDCATADDSADAGSDYTSQALQTLDFPADGALSQTVTVQVQGDALVEADENFFVNLSNPSVATIADDQGQGAIRNDDSAQLTVADVAQSESDGGMTFTVTLSNPVDAAVSVDASTGDDTAMTADNDYDAVSGRTMNFAAEETVQTFTVTINDDAKVEADETFLVTLSNLVDGGRDVSLDPDGVGSIENDDATALSIADATQSEGTGVTTDFIFTATLSAPSDFPVTVDYATANGTARSDSGLIDYIAASGVVTFPPGSVSQAITVIVHADTSIEDPTETFYINLSNPSGAAIADDQALGVIIDDDRAVPVVQTPVMGDFGMALLSLLLLVSGVMLIRRGGH